MSVYRKTVLILIAGIIAIISGFSCESYIGTSSFCGQPLHFVWRSEGVWFRQFTLVPFILDLGFFLIATFFANWAINRYFGKVSPKIAIATVLGIAMSIGLSVLFFFAAVTSFVFIVSSFDNIRGDGFGLIGIGLGLGYLVAFIAGIISYFLITLLFLYKLFKFPVTSGSVFIRIISQLPILIVGTLLGGFIGAWFASGVIDPLFGYQGAISFSAFFIVLLIILMPFAIKANLNLVGPAESTKGEPETESSQKS